MKLILFVIAALALVWLLRRSLGGGGRPQSRRHRRDRPDAAATGPQAMLACAHCGIHLPQNEALPGRGGVFCTEAHRSAYERAHPAP